jgi:ACS family D-galactonate transporter-like MFS transporter
MSVTTSGADSKPGGLSFLWNRQLDVYPETGARMTYLGITVLSTVMLYYELYVGGSVSTLFLQKLHMSFSFLVYTTAFGALIGAFGSLFAGITDRLGRTNIVVIGLIFTGVFVAFVIPSATSRWPFTIETWVVAAVEGMCLVATPALIRDFSPQVGRATAMGFWTSGPVLGSLVVFEVATLTIGKSPSPSFWTHEFHVCGIAGLVVAAIALIGLKELSPGLRDQLMVTMRDRALIEAKAKGIDVEQALRTPFRQLLKADVVLSAVGISVFLVIYYTAVLAGLIYFTTVFGFSVKDGDALGNWNWGFNVIAVVLIGFVSDYFKVRKPFMLIGGAAAAVMTVLYLEQAKHGPTTGYYHLAILVAALAFCLGVAYVPWMASFTELVENRNPALTATGLAIWGWIIRVVVFVSYLILPSVINTVTPLVTYGGTVAAAAAGSPRYHIPPQYPALAWAATHPTIVADVQKIPPPVLAAAQKIPPAVAAIATKDAAQLADAQRLAPELAVIQAHPALFAQLAANPTSKTLQADAVAAAGGGATGVAILGSIAANQTAIQAVIAVGPQLLQLAPYASELKTVAPYAAQLGAIAPYSAELTALGAVPKSVTAYVSAHGAAVANAAAKTAKQWQTWYWICFGCMIFFLATIPFMRGAWRPKTARKAEAEHEALVQAEMAKLGITA